MTKLSVKGKWVLVTGASSGLGAEMARQLARDYSANLVLMARREGRLIELKNELEGAYSCQCEVVIADLSNEAGYPAIFEQLRPLNIHAAILNAGVTHFDEDLKHEWPDFQSMLSTNVSAVVYFTRAFGNYFEESNQDGAILTIGSMAGFTPVPYQSAYSGTKAFLLNYCQAVRQEWKNKPYTLSLFAPSGINTEMNIKSGLNDYFADSMALQSAESCASDALSTLINRKVLFVPRLTNRLQAFGVKLMPRALINVVTGKVYHTAWLATQAAKKKP